ncbi:tRNA-dihydrouridine(16/17) synthase [NAD(P)(+)]-like [Chrysoperla carnea]|uniref:tRNA-dihydrouridine(16/17) synthase [NAD(P)(+)]-like n=1 Tax=Chrysoperla carnea TaxID=189513 RepID=UPI001D0937B0|nr:tRNA-dihydrouridine(16/17) synthase [NAD(P)(+)]-like [Chrysoperla carnea]
MQKKKKGFEFWKDVLGGPELIVAPMVDASELAWRSLCRRHGAQLCYTPMLHSSVFCRDPKYRKEALVTCPDDRPLIVQFCGNDPKILLEAALLAEDYCDAIDINLGCPQAIARRGHYGSFLQDEWNLLADIVSTLNKELKVPITCKVRVFEDIERTVKYAQMLESAGCTLLTVHGRTREQKGPLTGLADWNYIKAVREAVKIPVFANGNIQTLQDARRCILETGVVGVMSAEGNLYNPFIFEGRNPPSWEPALEYLDLVETYPCPNAYIRGHLFKIFHHVLALPENSTERSNLGTASTLEDFREVCLSIKSKYEKYHEGIEKWESSDYTLSFPPWICYSYVRLSPEAHVKKIEERNQIAENCRQSDDSDVIGKRPRYEDSEGNEITRKRMKKLRRIQRRPGRGTLEDIIANAHSRKGAELCEMCPNPMGTKCDYKLCKQCCRNKCYYENLDCPGHKIQIKTRREVASKFSKKGVKCTEDGKLNEGVELISSN